MPIFRLKEKVVYYCHVPKCGGTSVEDYLERRFGTLSFLDRNWEGLLPAKRWNNSSPQHIGVDALSRLFATSFFDAEFCVVRNPAQRFISAFKHARQNGSIPPRLNIYGLLSRIENANDDFHRSTDSHFRPATDFVSSGARIFKIEDNGRDLIEWLDELEGRKGDLRELSVMNRAHEVRKRKPRTLRGKISAAVLPSQPIPTDIEPKLANRIFDVYRQDYGRFQYRSPTQQTQ